MSRSRTVTVLALAALMASLFAIGFGLEEGHGGCQPPAGGRCKGRAAINQLTVSADRRTLGGVINCGGWLTAGESADRVTVTLTLDAVGAGAASCAREAVTVTLRAPVEGRAVVDSTRGAAITLAPGDPYSIS